MSSLADRLLTFLLALAGLAALRAVALRAHDELAAERAAGVAAARESRGLLAELVAAVQAPGQHVPYLETEPGLSKTHVSEDDEIQADRDGQREAIAETIMAEYEARMAYAIDDDPRELARLRDIAEGLVPAAPTNGTEPVEHTLS